LNLAGEDDRLKYPRTYHLRFSPGATRDDKVLASHDVLEGRQVVVTLKMDGENTTMYRDRVHARSLDSGPHESRWWVRDLQARIGDGIPEGWRVCGENMYAKHTIHYNALQSYFLAYSVWDDGNICLGWDETLEWLMLLGIVPVPVLYEGVWDEGAVRAAFPKTHRGDPCEGFVVRLREAFCYSRFTSSVAKYVDPKFRRQMEQDEATAGSKPWYLRAVVPNRLEK